MDFFAGLNKMRNPIEFKQIYKMKYEFGVLVSTTFSGFSSQPTQAWESVRLSHHQWQYCNLSLYGREHQRCRRSVSNSVSFFYLSPYFVQLY